MEQTNEQKKAGGYGIAAGIVLGLFHWLMSLPLLFPFAMSSYGELIAVVFTVTVLLFGGRSVLSNHHFAVYVVCAGSSFAVTFGVALFGWNFLDPQHLALAAVLSTSALILKRIFYDRRLARRAASNDD